MGVVNFVGVVGFVCTASDVLIIGVAVIESTADVDGSVVVVWEWDVAGCCIATRGLLLQL